MYIFLCLLLSNQIKLPETIQAKPGEFVVVQPATELKVLQYVPLTDGLAALPSNLLLDRRTGVFLAPTSGRYKVLVYGALDGTPTPPVFFTIEAKPTTPESKLSMDIKAAYDQDPSTTKADDAKKLYLCYTVVKNTDFNNLKTNADAFQAIGMIFEQCRLEPNLLRGVRNVIGDYLKKELGENSDAAFDQVKFKQIVQQLLDILSKLGV